MVFNAFSDALIKSSVLFIHNENKDTIPDIMKEVPIAIAEFNAMVANRSAIVFVVAPTNDNTYPPRLALAPFNPFR